METIVEGFVGGGTTTNRRKRHLRLFMTMEGKKKIKQHEPICFIEDDYGEIKWEHDDPMVNLAVIHNFMVKRILVDQGNLVDILYLHTTEAFNIPRSMYKSYQGILLGFVGSQVQVEGTITLRVTLGTRLLAKDLDVNFLIVTTTNNACNTMFGQPSLNSAGAILSTSSLIGEVPNAKRN